MGDTLAFVVPWYGSDIAGGAEAECRATARALAARGIPVEILTTCARDYASGWGDHHRPGAVTIDGLTVRRFRVRRRDARRYGTLQQRLRWMPLSPSEEAEFVDGSINSDDLYAYLGAEQGRYWYAFLPYCFGTTWRGALAAPARSLLIPCLHDEPFARLAATRRVLREVRVVCFHVPAERALAERLAGGDPGSFAVVGEGVDTDVAGDGERFRRKYGLHDYPFLLYAGRKQPEKNVPLLLDFYTRYRLTHPDSRLKLVLIGSGSQRVPERLGRDVLDLGFVPSQDKLDACAAALALCQPSLLESFSIVMMEAWLCGAPALVHGGCAVTREHCLASNGGLFFEEYFEFMEMVDLLLGDPALRQRLADNGRRYVLGRFTWDRVVENYLGVLGELGAKLG